MIGALHVAIAPGFFLLDRIQFMLLVVIAGHLLVHFGPQLSVLLAGLGLEPTKGWGLVYLCAISVTLCRTHIHTAYMQHMEGCREW